MQVDLTDVQCPSRAILEHVTSKWGVLVLHALRPGEPVRFSELRRLIGGVSEKMLTQTLRTLERDGLVRREVHPVIPPHVEYTLTPMGVEAADRLAVLAEWVEQNAAAVLEAQQCYDKGPSIHSNAT